MRSRERPQRIALFGNFGTRNLGNEASLKAILELIHRNRPDAQISVLCYGLDQARQEHDVRVCLIRSHPPSSLWYRILNRLTLKLPWIAIDVMRTFWHVRKFDMIIVPGTGILDDFGERWQAMPYDLFKWSLAARVVSCPFMLINVGAGPIRHPVSRWLMSFAARIAYYRSYRDHNSRTYMEKLGVLEPHDTVFPDLAFSLPVPQCARRLHHSVSCLTVGVGVMNYRGWNRTPADGDQIQEAYESQTAGFVEWLLGRGYYVRFLVGARSDQAAIERLRTRIATILTVVPASKIAGKPATSFQELMIQMSEMDIVVATRFHNVVAALMVSKPVLSIGYADKNAALLDEVGLGSFHQEVERLDFPLLIDQFEELVHRREEYAKVVESAVHQFRSRLKLQESVLSRDLL